MADPSPEFQPNDEIDELFSRANPNPTRSGCPPHDVLLAVAGKKLPIGDTAYEHLAKCSPCYREFRRIQQSVGQSRLGRSAKRVAWLTAAAAIVLVTVGAAWMLWSVRRPTSPPASVAAETFSAVAQPLQVDLRGYSVSRTDQQTSAVPPVPLMRSNLNLTILLPVGSEPGRYDVQLLDSTLQSQRSAAGQAAIENFVTTLQTTMDLRSLPPGAYQLALRHDGYDWRLFPASVK